MSGVGHPFVWYLKQPRALLPDMTMRIEWAGPTVSSTGATPVAGSATHDHTPA
jgi:hypothetical protein